MQVAKELALVVAAPVAATLYTKSDARSVAVMTLSGIAVQAARVVVVSPIIYNSFSPAIAPLVDVGTLFGSIIASHDFGNKINRSLGFPELTYEERNNNVLATAVITLVADLFQNVGSRYGF